MGFGGFSQEPPEVRSRRISPIKKHGKTRAACLNGFLAKSRAKRGELVPQAQLRGLSLPDSLSRQCLRVTVWGRDSLWAASTAMPVLTSYTPGR